MRYQTHQFIFHRFYEMASLVEGCVSNPEPFEELAWYDPDVLKCLAEFSKTSLLHYYIYVMIWIAERDELIGKDDIYERRKRIPLFLIMAGQKNPAIQRA